jgi:hypothetical protein
MYMSKYGVNFRPFEEARKYVHTLELKNYIEWREYCKSGKKPADIPTHPELVYNSWKSMGDWLGTGTIAPKDRHTSSG